MAYSYQEAVSDGTLQNLLISFEYFDNTEITVEVGGVPNGIPWVWGAGAQIIFSSPVPAGTLVRIFRTTDIDAPRHDYTGGAAFTAGTLDENLTQVLRIAQEAKEGGWGESTSDLRGDLSAGTGATIVGAVDGAMVTSVQALLDASVRSAELSAGTGAELVGFQHVWAGAVTRTTHDKLRESVSVKDFGAVGDGVTDDTVAVQTALDYCYAAKKTLFFPAGYYAVTESGPGSTYALRNRGVSMVGEGTFYSQIVPLASMPNTADFIRVTPDSGAYIDFMELGRLSIQPTYNGGKRGRSCIYMDFPQETNLSRLHMHNLYLLPGNDYSLVIDNNNVVNFQGVPANSVIEQCMFWEGTKLLKVGDSITIRNNVFRSSAGGREAIRLYISDTSGVASHCVITENNIDCVGGALYAIRGRSIKFTYNNVELSAGAGTANGAIIDLDGSSGTMPWCEVSGNHIGVFGTATPTTAIRVNSSVGATIDKNTILSGIAVANAILVTASASDTDIGFNEIQSNYTNAINNAGVKTIGAPIALGPLNSFTYTGGGYQTLSAFKHRNGIVTVTGVVNAPASPSGVVIATLPLGYRPTKLQRFAVSTVSGGAIVVYAMEVDTAGNLVCYCNTNTTRIEINASFQTINYVVGSL